MVECKDGMLNYRENALLTEGELQKKKKGNEECADNNECMSMHCVASTEDDNATKKCADEKFKSEDECEICLEENVEMEHLCENHHRFCCDCIPTIMKTVTACPTCWGAVHPKFIEENAVLRRKLNLEYLLEDFRVDN